ncbi:hypothetical protein GGR58DRAFT_411162 [Xylaria digitata]|nr:hypothetical protein GGR58DRAFT_411162 [Xylaria digitata]
MRGPPVFSPFLLRLSSWVVLHIYGNRSLPSFHINDELPVHQSRVFHVPHLPHIPKYPLLIYQSAVTNSDKRPKIHQQLGV